MHTTILFLRFTDGEWLLLGWFYQGKIKSTIISTIIKLSKIWSVLSRLYDDCDLHLNYMLVCGDSPVIAHIILWILTHVGKFKVTTSNFFDWKSYDLSLRYFYLISFASLKLNFLKMYYHSIYDIYISLRCDFELRVWNC